VIEPFARVATTTSKSPIDDHCRYAYVEVATDER
jgi:hypothetical protein